MSTKNFYKNLYKEKKKDNYCQIYERNRKDFLHKYLLFWLNPYKNNRHATVAKILPKGERVLDIGCWDGEGTLKYGVHKKFKEVYGVDITPQAVAQAQKKGIKAQVVDLNTEKLPFKDSFFDVVTLIAVLEHLFEPYNVLAEIKRVLKNKGTFILCVPNVASLSNRLRIISGRRPRTSYDVGWDGGHLLYFTPRDLTQLLNEFNFFVTEKLPTGNLYWLRKLLFSLTGEIIFKCQLKK
jgi:methionine biosynthesis protein MetW